MNYSIIIRVGLSAQELSLVGKYDSAIAARGPVEGFSAQQPGSSAILAPSTTQSILKLISVV